MTATRRPLPALMFALVALAACATFPELDRTAPAERAVTPQLLPVDQLLAQADAPPRATEAVGQGLAARAARLRARAALMRGPVHQPDTRARLSAAIRAGQA